MRANPDMVEIGDISQADYQKEIDRYKVEAQKESREAVERAADEFVGGLGESREGVLAAMQNEEAAKAPEEFVSG